MLPAIVVGQEQSVNTRTSEDDELRVDGYSRRGVVTS